MNTRKLVSYAFGPLGSAVVGAVLLPLMSWIFSADDIGRVVLLQTVASLVLLTIGLGLDQAYIREYHQSAHPATLLKTIIILPFSLFGILALAWSVRPQGPSELLFNLPRYDLGTLCILFIGAMLGCRYLSIVLRMQERALAFSFSQIMPKLTVLTIVLAYLTLGSDTSTFQLLAAFTIGQIFTLLLLIWQTRQDIIAAKKSRIDTALLSQLLRYGTPLAAGGLVYWGLTSLDRFLLKHISGLSELGIYSMAVNFSALALIVQSIFSTIWAPMVFKWVNENRNLDRIAPTVRIMLGVVVILLCLAGLASPLIPLLLPAEYAPVQFILVSSMIFPLFYTLTEVTAIGINVTKQTWLITLSAAIALLLNLGLLYLLIPPLGAKGAAIATSVAFWLFSVLKTEASIRLWQPLPRLAIYGTTATCLIVSTMYTALGNSSNYPVFALLWLVTIFILAKIYTPEIKQTTSWLKGRLKFFARKD